MTASPAHVSHIPVPPSGHATVDRPATAVALREVSKVFGHGAGAVHALDRVSLDVRAGEFLCLVGASGCGKSTILNLIAGLERPTSGVVAVPAGRSTLMFQDAALFPWLTVEQNVAFPLEMRGTSRTERRERVGDLLRLVHLEGFRTKRPHELSGGMRQRVALARALAHGADVLLMDEPFGALDAMMRDVLHEELERLWLDSGRTVVFVTHNVREAVRLGDRVVVLSSRPGRVAAEFAIQVERPRRLESPDVATLAAAITARLRDEVLRHAAA
jgi:NitT/TauT family transport system ATP-binding protein